jgi:hypothetical protein
MITKYIVIELYTEVGMMNRLKGESSVKASAKLCSRCMLFHLTG